MDNWQPGDLALCVNVADRVYPDRGMRGTAGRRLRPGGVYTVKGTGGNIAGNLTLVFDELTAGAWRFRKIHPHAPDAEDRETIELLTGKPLLAPVGGGEG